MKVRMPRSHWNHRFSYPSVQDMAEYSGVSWMTLWKYARELIRMINNE